MLDANLRASLRIIIFFRLEKDIEENLPLTSNFIALLTDNLAAAYEMRGGNLGLVNSYKDSLKNLQKYETQMHTLVDGLNQSAKLLLEIESFTDLLFAEIDNDSFRFTEPLSQANFVNEFSGSKKSISNLKKTIEKSSNTIESFVKKIDVLISQLEPRKNEVANYLKGPKNPHLIYKNHDEFHQELDILKANIEVLNLTALILPTFSKTKASLLNQVEGLGAFIEDLEKINLNYAKNLLLNKKNLVRKTLLTRFFNVLNI